MQTAIKNNAAGRKRRVDFAPTEVVSIDGHLDANSARGLMRAIRRLLQSGLRRCILDLTAVDAVDSAGFGTLIGSVRKIEEAGGTSIVVCANPTVRRLFEIAGVTRFVPVVSNFSDVREIFAA